MFRSQVLSALVLARKERKDWLGSPEAAHLFDVVRGPVDWTTTAALVGLVERARQDPHASANIVEHFVRWLQRPMTPIWYMCARVPMLRLLMLVPNLDPEIHAVVVRQLKEMESDESDKWDE
jgi:hypothetical protein